MNTSQNRIKIYQRDKLPELVKLEANQLGRPWHKLPKLMNSNFDIIDARLSIFFLKKIRISTALKSMSFSTDRNYKNTQIFSTPYGNIAFVIDRILLLTILHYYYGLSKDNNLDALDCSQPVTKTEERLQNKLGQELTELIMNKETFGENLEIKNDHSAVINRWSWCITFTLEGYDCGSFSILLDHHHVDQMLATFRVPDGSSDSSPKNTTLSPGQIERQFDTLPLKLVGRLASLNLTVAQLTDIKPGDIIPVSINELLPIFIGKEQIFDSIIAEDRGKLFFCNIHDKTTEKTYE